MPAAPQLTGRQIAKKGLIWAQTGMFRRAVLVDASLAEASMIARSEGRRMLAWWYWFCARRVAEHRIGRLRRRMGRMVRRRAARLVRRKPAAKGKKKHRREWLGGLLYWE